MKTKNLLRAMKKIFNGTRKRRLLWLYGLASVTSLLAFVTFWSTNVFRDAILSNLELRNGSSSFLQWQRPSVGLALHVYVFNYTNLKEFESGDADKLRVEEVGPFVYRETLNRVNPRLNENGTITYQEKRSFQWISGESEDQIVVVPNVLLISVLAYVKDSWYESLMNLVLLSLSSKRFLELPVGKYLWGYEDQLFRTIKPFVSLKEHVPFEKFGILAFRNGVNDDRITIHSGVNDLRNIGLIERVNGMQDRKIWGDKRCDAVYGTDGSIFPPHWIDQPHNTELRIYAKDVCRQLPFRYERHDYANGIPTLRYTIPSDIFTSTSDENSCFCPKESADSATRICPPMGTFNISGCKLNTPILVSFPHFYSANKSLFEDIDGLKPTQEHCESYIHIHQRLGVTVAARIKMQINVEVREVGGMPFVEHLKDGTILPLIWTDSQVEDLPESLQLTLYRGHYLLNAIEAGFQWCSLIGVALSFGALVAVLYKNEQGKLDGKFDGKLDGKLDVKLDVKLDPKVDGKHVHIEVSAM